MNMSNRDNDEQNEPNWAMVPRTWLQHFSSIVPNSIISRAAGTCKRWRDAMRTNVVWSKRAQLLEKSQKYNKRVFKKVQKDPYFWYKWCLDTMPIRVRVTKARRHIFRVEGRRYMHHVPRVGCLLLNGTINYTEVWICVDVDIPMNGKYSGVPKTFKVCKVMHPKYDDILNPTFDGWVVYQKDSILKIGLNDEFNPQNKFVLIIPHEDNVPGN